MGLNFGHVRLYSAFPLRKFFQRVTDAWFVKFVRQRENCQCQWLPVFSFGVTLYPCPLQYQ